MSFPINKTSQRKTPITPSARATEKESILKKEITLFGKAFSSKYKEGFYTEMGVLLQSGIHLKDALKLLASSEKKQSNKDLFNELLDKVVLGSSLSDAMRSRKEFTDHEFYSIRIGEETGTLAKVMQELGVFYARKNEQRRHVTSALTYPIIILMTAFLVVAFMLRYVVPMFQDIFKQNGVKLPPITRFIIALSEVMREQFWWIAFITSLLIGGIYLIKKKRWFKRGKDQFLARFPVLGKFIRTVHLSQFAQAVSLLVSAKVPMVSSIQMVKKMVNFIPLQEALEDVENSLLKGRSLSDSLQGHAIFDDKMISLVKVAEETNQTEFIFERLNEQYDQQVQQRSKLLSTVLEPFIIVFIGIVVGVILIAMYLPMFELSNVLG